MQRTKTITIDDRDIVAKELSVAQVRNLMDNMSESSVSTIDMLFPGSIPSVVIAESTGLSVEKLEEVFHPSEIKQIIEVVENINPFFTNMISTLAAAGGRIVSEKT